ncbi:MAG: PDZ domain-containing protein [Terriglobia bacterium]
MRKSGKLIWEYIVMPGSPAETAGLEIQDIILSIDDKPVGSLPIFGM